MTAFLIAILIYLPISIFTAIALIRRRDLGKVLLTVLIAWSVLSLMVVVMNDAIPFADGGDDYLYYYSTQISHSASSVLDFNRFAGLIEQPGYPLLLGPLSLIAGDDLVAYKLFNLLLLISCGLIWYRIGVVLSSPAFGRALMVGILLTTPLWYYVFFLLKEMSIVLFQSLFLWGLVESYARRSIRPWLLVAAATVPLTLFRVPLILQNASVAITALTASNLSRGRRSGFLPLAAAAAIFALLIIVASNADFMRNIGVSGTSQILGSEEMEQRTQQFRAQSSLNVVVFPLIYLFTETSGLTPETWQALGRGGLSAAGPQGVRGLLALPWILLTTPFFALGVRWIMGVPRELPRPRGFVEWFRSLRAVTTPWGAVLLFVLSSMALSWVVGDTTRWRVADMPGFVAIAMAGWYATSKQLRLIVLLSWPLLVAGLATVFYTLL